MPAGLIEDENGVSAGADPGGDFVQVQLHGLTVAGRQDKSGARAQLGTDGTEQVGRLGTLIMCCAWPRAFPGPAIGQLVLLADPHFILEPHLYGCARCECLVDFLHAVDEVFLNASMASASCL